MGSEAGNVASSVALPGFTEVGKLSLGYFICTIALGDSVCRGGLCRAGLDWV